MNKLPHTTPKLLFVLCSLFIATALTLTVCDNGGPNNNIGEPKCNHDWSEWEDSAAVTCTAPALETRICNLDPSHTETRPKQGSAALGHIFDWIEKLKGLDTSTGICKRVGCNQNAAGELRFQLSEMALIKAGTFTMGSPPTEPGHTMYEIQHQVTLTNDFYMGKYVITQEQYQAVMGINPSFFNGEEGREPVAGDVQERRPVEMVNWYHAIAFCNRLSILAGLTPVYTIAGKSNTNAADWIHSAVPTTRRAVWDAVTADWNADGYRLPTEAEWEYACRAGTTTAFYPGGGADGHGWFSAYSIAKTHEVGKFRPNPWGLFDKHGNVWEWCWNWHSLYDTGAQTDPKGPSSGSSRVGRGGSWDNDGRDVRSAYRYFASPSFRYDNIGFRLALTSSNLMEENNEQ